MCSAELAARRGWFDKLFLSFFKPCETGSLFDAFSLSFIFQSDCYWKECAVCVALEQLKKPFGDAEVSTNHI